MKITVQNVDAFIQTLATISKIVTNAKFTFTKDSFSCLFKNETIARCSITSSASLAEDECHFCTDDINKILSALMLVKKYEKLNRITLNFNSRTLSYKGNKTEFNIQSVKEEIITSLDSPILTKLDPYVSFDCDYETIKDAISNKNILSANDDVRFIFCSVETNPKMVYLNLINTANPNSNNLTFHVANVTTGQFDPNKKLILDQQRLLMPTHLKVDQITASCFAAHNIIMFESATTEIKFKIYTSMLKQ